MEEEKEEGRELREREREALCPILGVLGTPHKSTSSVGASLPPTPPGVDCFLPEECLGYGLVVPFPAYGFAALVPHNESLNSLNRAR